MLQFSGPCYPKRVKVHLLHVYTVYMLNFSEDCKAVIQVYHCPHKHYRPKTNLEELSSVKITAWLPTKMFPELFLAKITESIGKITETTPLLWQAPIDWRRPVNHETGRSCFLLLILWLQRVTFPVPEIPSQNAPNSGEIQEVWQSCQIPRFKTQNSIPRCLKFQGKYRKSRKSCRRRKGAVHAWKWCCVSFWAFSSSVLLFKFSKLEHEVFSRPDSPNIGPEKDT